MKESLESRVAKLEQKVNELLCENANNAATIDFVAMMADVEIPESEDQEGEGDEYEKGKHRKQELRKNQKVLR